MTDSGTKAEAKRTAVRFALNITLLQAELKQIAAERSLVADLETVDEADRLIKRARSLGLTNLPDVISKANHPAFFVAWWQVNAKENTDGHVPSDKLWQPFFNFLASEKDEAKKACVFRAILSSYLAPEFGAELARKVLDLRERPSDELAGIALTYLHDVARESARTILMRLLGFEKRLGVDRHLQFLTELALSEDGRVKLSLMCEADDLKPHHLERLGHAYAQALRSKSADLNTKTAVASELISFCRKSMPKTVQSVHSEYWRQWIESLRNQDRQVHDHCKEAVLTLYQEVCEFVEATRDNPGVLRVESETCKSALLCLLARMSHHDDILTLIFPLLNSACDFVALKEGLASHNGHISRSKTDYNTQYRRLTRVVACLNSVLSEGGNPDRLASLIEANPEGSFVHALSFIKECDLSNPSYIKMRRNNARVISQLLYTIAKDKKDEDVRVGLLGLAYHLAIKFGFFNKDILEGRYPEFLELALQASEIELQSYGKLRKLLLALATWTEDTCSIHGQRAFHALTSSDIPFLTESEAAKFWALDRSLLFDHLKTLKAGPGHNASFAFDTLGRTASDESIKNDRPLLFACIVHLARLRLEEGIKLVTYTGLNDAMVQDILTDAYALGLEYSGDETIAEEWQKAATELALQAHKLF